MRASVPPEERYAGAPVGGRDECPGAVPIIVCHDEVVVECEAGQAVEVKTWLEKVMIDGMEAVLSGTDEVDAPVEVEARISESWGGG